MLSSKVHGRFFLVVFKEWQAELDKESKPYIGV